MKLDTNRRTTVGRALTDGLFQRYTSWRNQSDAVQRAYEAWVSSEGANRDLAYARYLAALDQEELAAADYRDQFAWIRTVSGGKRS